MSTRNPSFTNTEPCQHLADYKLKHSLNGYRSIQRYLIAFPFGRTSVQKSNTGIPRCVFCNGYQGRLYFCLICSSISCLDHTLLHGQSENGHILFLDIKRAELYCSLCSDQVYDPDFDMIVMSKHITGIPISSFANESIGARLTKRRRLLGSGYEFNLRKSKEGNLFLRDRRAKSCYPLGLRGLNNLGSTCFMNSVLQALLHTPPFRNYFLSGGHHPDVCRKTSSDKLCLSCDVYEIFSAVFSGDRLPYSPAQFLYSWWQHSANLASYEQQDAHEFFISLLDRIHEQETKTRSIGRDDGDCQCIAHRVFSGLLRSDVTCMNCGFTSTTHDPCLDISLDLGTIGFSSSAVVKKLTKPTKNSNMSTLSGCLYMFTRPEKLGSDQKLYCQNCKEMQDSSKQMSIRRLPLVLCLHIKRFEHSLVKKMSRKINHHLHYPLSLDMTPYLASSIVRNRYGNRIFAVEGDDSDSSAEYEVFAVVTHSGTLESGHYISYLRLGNQWYKCDDAWITEADESTVRASQCYMIFYVQKMFYHKASEDLDFLPISPQRDAFRPVAGCCCREC